MSEASIADLCKPLSAKVMPKRLLLNNDHTERSNDEAMKRQRAGEVVRIWRRQKRLKGPNSPSQQKSNF
jgi:hypothetical protein